MKKDECDWEKTAEIDRSKFLAMINPSPMKMTSGSKSEISTRENEQHKIV